MTTLEVFKMGFGRFWQFKRMWWLLYALTFGMALLIALPIQSYLKSHSGQSLMVEDLMKGFNYTFFNDFLNNYGSGVAPIVQQSVLVIVLFLLLMIFLAGGIFNVFLIVPKSWDRNLFWGSSAHYFWKMLRMTVYFFVIHGLVLGIFLFIYSRIASGATDDTIIFQAWKFLLPVYILVSAFFFMWHDYAKAILVKENKKWLYQSIIAALKLIIRHFKKAYGLYLINVSILFLIYFLNIFINHNLGLIQHFPIGFLFTQVIILARLGMKLVNWSCVSVLCEKL